MSTILRSSSGAQKQCVNSARPSSQVPTLSSLSSLPLLDMLLMPPVRLRPLVLLLHATFELLQGNQHVSRFGLQQALARRYQCICGKGSCMGTRASLLRCAACFASTVTPCCIFSMLGA